MISAACPNCSLILVEANTNTWADVGASEDEAVKLGATVINNSYVGHGARKSDYTHKGVTIVASAGDSGYATGDPADFASVVAVGGTSLTRGGGSRGWTEIVWSGTGGGCSPQPKPSWQHDTGCSTRTANDVAAVADPNTGVAMYDTYGRKGWFEVGGTSASAPIVAGIFGLAGNATKQTGGKTFWETKHRKYLNDVTSGSDGACTPSYLCTAGPGYDGPTGWGTPNGTGAF
jgi:subtilase family serine protease